MGEKPKNRSVSLDPTDGGAPCTQALISGVHMQQISNHKEKV